MGEEEEKPTENKVEEIGEVRRARLHRRIAERIETAEEVDAALGVLVEHDRERF